MLTRWFLLICILPLLVGCGGTEPASSTASSGDPDLGAAPVPIAPERKWYEGGDLHQASIGQWKAGTYENRLATSADMIANVKQFSSVEEMRSAAEELEKCISKTAEGAEAEQQRVTEVAAACALLMGY